MSNKKPKILTKKEAKKLEKIFPEWKLDKKGTKAIRTFDFDSHIDALIFIARSTVNAEVLKHYPDITFTFCKVKIVVTTHEVKALTKQDIQLISRIDHVAQSQQQSG